MGWPPEGQDWVRTNVNRPAILKTAVDTLDKTGVESRKRSPRRFWSRHFHQKDFQRQRQYRYCRYP